MNIAAPEDEYADPYAILGVSEEARRDIGNLSSRNFSEIKCASGRKKYGTTKDGYVRSGKNLCAVRDDAEANPQRADLYINPLMRRVSGIASAYPETIQSYTDILESIMVAMERKRIANRMQELATRQEIIIFTTENIAAMQLNGFVRYGNLNERRYQTIRSLAVRAKMQLEPAEARRAQAAIDDGLALAGRQEFYRSLSKRDDSKIGFSVKTVLGELSRRVGVNLLLAERPVAVKVPARQTLEVG
jgi:hypothetical protein